MNTETLFDSVQWRDIIKSGLGGRIVCLSGPNGERMPWTLISRVGLTVAFPRFPVGLVPGDEWLIADMETVKVALLEKGVDLIKMSAPATFLTKSITGNEDVISLPETCILDLHAWSADALSATVRRKFRFAESYGLVIQSVEVDDGRELHRLYINTIKRQGGRVRYTFKYFEALCSETQKSSVISVGKVVTPNNEIVGFIVVGHDERCSYYLHGGFDERFSTQRPGYFAMRWAIELSRNRGKELFNFLVSPKGQPTLRAYKESFGGQTLERLHWQQSLTSLGFATILALKAVERFRTIFRRATQDS